MRELIELGKKHKEQFASIKLSELKWRGYAPTNNAAGYTQAILTKKHFRWLTTNSNFLYSPFDISVSIRKYPSNYYIAIMIEPAADVESDEGEYTHNGEGDGLIPALADVSASIVIAKLSHYEFETNTYRHLSDLWERLKGADFEALHTSVVAKLLRGK